MISGPGRPAGGRRQSGPPIFSKPTLIVSLGLHLALIFFLAFGLPSCQEDKAHIDPSQVITVQLLEEPSPPPPDPVEPPPEAAPEPKPAPPPAFEMPLGESRRNLQRSGPAEAEAEAAEDLIPPPPLPEEQIALGPKDKAPPPELEKRRDRTPEVKAPKVERESPKPRPTEPDYSKVPQSLYRTLGRDAGAIHFGFNRGRWSDPVVSRYFELAMIKFNEHWTRPQGLSPGLVVGISLTIEPNGRISYVQINQSSGSTAYDRSVVQAIRKSSPLSPLPPVFGGRRFSDSFGLIFEGQRRR